MKRMSLLTVLIVLGAGLLIYAYADQEHGYRQGYRMGPGYMHEGMGPGMGFGGHEGMGPGMGFGGHEGMGFGGHEGMGFDAGPGTVPGMGPGMMPFWKNVPEEKQKQMEQLHQSMGVAMMAKMVEARDKSLELRGIMHKYPMDQQAAGLQWQSLIQTREETFKLRMGMISQMQQILGETLWREMEDGRRHRPYNRPRE
jgi:hypothetical protein